MDLNFKKITSITKIHKKTKVVNFSVKTNENYFANGILTHNCYMKRNKYEGLSIARNTGDILTAINNHSYFTNVDKPNQTHGKYTTYDISCNEDFALHSKYHEWEKIFDFFKQHPLAMGSFATKYVNVNLLDYNPEGKIRIRFSLMPYALQKILEPNTSSIYERLSAIQEFRNAGYQVHLNFSPVIVHDNWLHHYEGLFRDIANMAKYRNWDYDTVKAEVIFLTHNEEKHRYNVEHKLPGEEFLWTPKIQEGKISQYGGRNVRYEHNRKADYIKQFIQIHDSIIPWNTIRYCFTFLLLLSQIV
jgi:spore photoproduct lyase